MKQIVSLGELIDSSWNTLQKHWRPTLKYTLWVLLVPLAFNILNAVLIAMDERLAQNVVLQLSMTLALVLGVLVPSIKLMKYLLAVDRLPNKTPDVGLTFTDILHLLLILVVMMICLIPAFILFVIPGIWISQLLQFSMLSYLEDGEKGFGALKASWRMVTGRWWAVFVRVLVPSLLYGMGAGMLIAALFFFAIFAGGLLFGGGIFLLSAFAYSNAALGAVLTVVGWILIAALIFGFFLFYGAIIVASQLLTTSAYVRLYHSLKESQA